MTVTTCGEPLLTGAPPSMPVPSDWNWTVAVPEMAPAAAVLRATCRPELLLDPAASPVTEPLALETCGVLPVMLASRFSEKPSVAAVLVTLILPASVPPMRTLPRLSGVVALPVAKRKTLPVTVTTCGEPLLTGAPPSMPVPSDWN